MSSRTLRVVVAAMVSTALALPGATAQAADPGAARVQLQKGYALKQAGKCAEALPYFAESLRLDRQPKVLIHLADCEREIGKYVSAEEHLVAARDLGRERGLAGFVGLAEGRLSDLEKHLPRLTVRLAADAPEGSVVSRDGVVLAPLSLGVALPVDPGAHDLRVRGGGRERQYSIDLRDSESKEIEITTAGGRLLETAEVPAPPRVEPPPALTHPTAPVPLAAEPAHPALPATGSSAAGAPRTTPDPARSSRRSWGFVAAGAGVAALGVSGYFRLRMWSRNQDADKLCTPDDPCTDDGRARYDDAVGDARTARTASLVAFAAGGALLATGCILLFTGAGADRQAVTVAPAVGSHALGATVNGVW